VTKALEVLQTLPPNKLFISEDFTKRGRGNVRLRDSGAKAGVKLYTIVPQEPPVVQPAAADDEVEEVSAEDEAAAAEAEIAATKKKSSMPLIAGAAVAVLLLLGGGGVLHFQTQTGRRSDGASRSAAENNSTTGPAAATPDNPRKIFVQPFTVEGTDPALADRANVVRLATIEVLRA
jgi:hypothetical protein